MQPEQTLEVDRLAADAGAMVEFREVLLVGNDGDVQVGAPFVEGARVVAEVLDQGRDRKLLVFKYKNKVRYRRRHGHRQAFTRLAIRQILTAGGVATAEERKPARPVRKRAAPKVKVTTAGEAEATALEAHVEAIEAGEATAQPRPRRASRARKPAEKAQTTVASEASAEVKPRRTSRSRKATRAKAGQPESENSPEAAEGGAKPARRTRAKKTETGE